MTKFFFDTEFIEYAPSKNEKGTIDLISIGIVSDNGREYYAIYDGFDESKASDWVKENVITKLETDIVRKSMPQISKDIIEFVYPHGRTEINPEFYAYFCSYDWVVFCWIFGSTINLPDGFPMWCRDLKHIMTENDISRLELPEQNEATHHNALDDARWNLLAYNEIQKIVAN